MMKYFIYIVACTLLFLLIFNAFTNEPAEPVNVATTFEWEKPVDIYLVSLLQEELDCEARMTVKRMIPNAETLGPGALNALIEGPNAEEKAKYFSAVNPNTLIQKFEIRDKVAYVDLSSELNQSVAGSCNVIAIRSQIENTLNALPDIDSVVLSVNGETEGILEP